MNPDIDVLHRSQENNFSFWFPKVEHCGIPVPKSYFKELPTDPEERNPLYGAFCSEHPAEDKQTVQAWLDREVIPDLKAQGFIGPLFLKNGKFSNKFSAKGSCILYNGIHDLASALMNINFSDFMVEAGGTGEVVVRELILCNHKATPCIYDGLPLRSEFRVFYDFESKKPLFTVNYWDYDYVYPHLYDATDKIIFEHERERIDRAFKENADRVQDMVAEAMAKVAGLTGQWSVDILMDEQGKFWLIDMAIAQMSAYWEKRP